MKETLHIYSRATTRVQEDGTLLSTQQELGKERAKQLGMKAKNILGLARSGQTSFILMTCFVLVESLLIALVLKVLND